MECLLANRPDEKAVSFAGREVVRQEVVPGLRPPPNRLLPPDIGANLLREALPALLTPGCSNLQLSLNQTVSKECQQKLYGPRAFKSRAEWTTLTAIPTTLTCPPKFAGYHFDEMAGLRDL